MRPLPNLDNVDDMMSRGRRSALMSARNEACCLLRDAVTSIQSAPLGEETMAFAGVELAIKRLREVSKLWAEVDL